MNTTTSWNIFKGLSARNGDVRKELFREKFQRSMRSCIQRGFSIEEAFGMIWVETWEEVAISEDEQSELYGELIAWAKSGVNDRVSNHYSQGLFTMKSPVLMESPR